MNCCLTLYNDIPFSFGIDENDNYGYIKAGADTVTPFSSLNGDYLWNYRVNYDSTDYCNINPSSNNSFFTSNGKLATCTKKCKVQFIAFASITYGGGTGYLTFYKNNTRIWQFYNKYAGVIETFDFEEGDKLQIYASGYSNDNRLSTGFVGVIRNTL